MACAVVVALVALVLPLFARFITKVLLEGHGPEVLHGILVDGVLMLLLVAIHTLCSAFVDYRGHMMGAMMERDMRAELFDHFTRLSFRFYDERRTGRLMTRITDDLFSLAEFYHHGPEDLVIGVLTIVGVFAASVAINPRLSLVVLLFVPIMAVYAFYFHRKMIIATRRSRDRIGDINAQVEDTLAGVRVVQSFTNEELEAAKFARENGRFLESRSDEYAGGAFFSGGLGALTQLLTIAVIVLGAVDIVRGALDLPDLLTYLLYVGLLIEPVRRLVNFARLYQEGVTGFARFAEMLEVEPEIHDAPNAIEVSRLAGRIELNGVSFRYHEDHDYVLKGVSLEIPAGELVALVGPSGVGKTTLCSLIPRLYETTEGEILIDGMDIKSMRLRALRRNVGIVQQDVYLFAGSVAENIRYGRPDAPERAVIEAAKKAFAHDFIMELPNGYDTNIGQRGVKLSGGQKQRLSIARVFLKDPPIIIFDEATSALDNASERAVQQSMEQLAANRTTIVIAHRLSTVRRARRIIVLTELGIEAQGTHDELLAMDRTYAGLYRVQFEV